MEVGKLYKGLKTGNIYMVTEITYNGVDVITLKLGRDHWSSNYVGQHLRLFEDAMVEYNQPFTIQNPTPIDVEFTMDEIAAKLGIEVRRLKIKK